MMRLLQETRVLLKRSRQVKYRFSFGLVGSAVSFAARLSVVDESVKFKGRS